MVKKLAIKIASALRAVADKLDPKPPIAAGGGGHGEE